MSGCRIGGKEYVLRAYIAVFKRLGLIKAELEYFLCARGIAEAVGKVIIAVAHQLVRPRGHVLCAYTELGQGARRRPLALFYEPQQQMLAAHVIVAHLLGAGL